ncbi:MAG: hypothetical protein HKN67_12510 [Saprospiraceae bacterium]|nr:hypothetical protein [Saprospiraceae bacterium]
MKEIIKLGGISILCGGVFFIITNALLTPFIDFKASFSEVANSEIFLYRMISAAFTVFFLLIATPGIYLYQNKRNSKFGFVAFLIAFAGGTFLFANEWYQVFILPEIAASSPDAIDLLDSSGSFSTYDFGAFLALITFTVGWLLIAIHLIRSGFKPRITPGLIIAGFFLIPILSAIISPSIGGAIGSTVLGLGFIAIGIRILQQT